jgi:imidazolonepropionase-like amidohydrolase
MVNALDAGVDCLEHAGFLVPPSGKDRSASDPLYAVSGVTRYDRGVAARMAESGTFVSYTFQSGGYDSLVDLRKRASQEGLTRQEQARRAALEAYFDKKIEVFAHLTQDGLTPRLLVSTDAGPFDAGFGRMNYGLELAVMAGMTPAQAILAATRIAADACGVSHLVGSIEPGKDADLLVARGNPLADISNIANVLAVYKGGCLVAPTTTAPTGRTAAMEQPSLH